METPGNYMKGALMESWLRSADKGLLNEALGCFEWLAKFVCGQHYVTTR